MQDAMMDGSARKEFSVSTAAKGSLKETAAVVLSATMRPNTVALALRSRRVPLKSYAISAPLASSRAAPLMIMLIATIFLGMERLRKEIIVAPPAAAAWRCLPAGVV